MALPFLARSTGQPIHPRGFVSPDLRTIFGISQKVRLGNQLLKLADLSDIVRNDNGASSILKTKAGPHGLIILGGGPTMFLEAAGVLKAGPFDFEVGPAKSTANVLQGTWSVPTTRSFSPLDNTSWENWEFSPSSVQSDTANSRLVMFAHGGNNSGTRKIGRAFSTDGLVGADGNWTRDAGNPIMTVGSAGAYDDLHVADFKTIQNPSTGQWYAFYRATKNGAGYSGSIARAALTSLGGAVTKMGEVLVGSGWCSAGICPGGLWYDVGGRLHMFVASTAGVGIGWTYSDDDGASWSSITQVASAGGVGSYDKSCGDVAQLVNDGDVNFITYSGENPTDYATNPPLAGIAAAITPARKVAPTRPGKFYSSTGQSTTVTASSLLNQTTYTIMGRFRAYRLNRAAAAARAIFTEFAAFNKEITVQMAGAGASVGKVVFKHATPTANFTITSTLTYDDALWHTFVCRRISSGSFEFYIDGSLINTSAANPSTDATATTKAVGNWPPAASGVEGDCVLKGTVSDVGLVTGAAWTAAEGLTWIGTRTPGAGGTVVFDSVPNGTDVGDVALVEALQPPAFLAITTAAETDAALAPAIALGIGIASGTNAALAQALSLGVGLATETNTALAPSLALGITPATETDQAFRAAPSLGTALETDTAFARPMVLGVGTAIGTNTAFAQKLALGIAPANENDVALHGGALIAPALETDSAFAPGRTLGILPANDNEAATGPGIRLSIVAALEFDAALVTPTRPAPPSRTRAVGRGGRAGHVTR